MVTFLTDAIDEFDGLAQTIEIQQVWGDRGRVEIC